jgi:cytochrome c556
VLLIGLAACTSGPAQPAAEEQTSVAPQATTATPADVVPQLSFNELMVTMVDNAGHVLWDVEKPDFKPKDEADWLEVQDHATQLVAASTLLQMGGAGARDTEWARDAKWRADAQAMGTAAMTALAAARTRDLESLVKANGGLVDSCESCHKTFKPDLPTEGIVHQRPHSESHQSNR